MKKYLFACLLALPLTAAGSQEASAWCKFNFGVGANVGLQSGGSKSLLWGLWQSSDFNAVNPALVTGPGITGTGAYPGNAVGPSGQDWSQGWMSPMTAAPRTQVPATTVSRDRPVVNPGTPDRSPTAAPVGYTYQNSQSPEDTGGYYQPPAYQVPSYWYDN